MNGSTGTNHVRLGMDTVCVWQRIHNNITSAYYQYLRLTQRGEENIVRPFRINATGALKQDLIKDYERNWNYYTGVSWTFIFLNFTFQYKIYFDHTFPSPPPSQLYILSLSIQKSDSQSKEEWLNWERIHYCTTVSGSNETRLAESAL